MHKSLIYHNKEAFLLSPKRADLKISIHPSGIPFYRKSDLKIEQNNEYNETKSGGIFHTSYHAQKEKKAIPVQSDGKQFPCSKLLHPPGHGNERNSHPVFFAFKLSRKSCHARK